MSKAEKLKNFDPNGVGLDNGHFIGLPFNEEESDLVLLSVPWDVTVSYGAGTAQGPANILEASKQLDLYDADYPQAWQRGIFMRPPSDVLLEKSRTLRPQAEVYIQELEAGKKLTEYPALKEIQEQINLGCEEMVGVVKKISSVLLAKEKLIGLVGGDHSTPLGFLQALAERHPDFGILQIDAHQDLRKDYEGFTYSHASIFNNALELPAISKLIQLGVRDHCDAEVALVNESKGRIELHTMDEIRRAQFEGQLWPVYIDKIIKALPQKVYLSLDIDGLDPSLCPNTGTPVPGGFTFSEIRYLLKRLVDSGKQLIGFDLCEVAKIGHEWDGNVGARMLYSLSGAMLQSNPAK